MWNPEKTLTSPELRLLIYRELFAVTDAVHIGTQDRRGRYPEILRASKLIYQEAVYCLYTETLLVLHLHSDFQLETAFRHDPREDTNWELNGWPAEPQPVAYKTKQLGGPLEPHVFVRFRHVVLCFQNTVKARYLGSWLYQDFTLELKEIANGEPFTFLGQLLERSFDLRFGHLDACLVLDDSHSGDLDVEALKNWVNTHAECIIQQARIFRGCAGIGISFRAVLKTPERCGIGISARHPLLRWHF